MKANEITTGLPVWAPIFKKQADIPAIILEATAALDGGMLCTLELEIEDPFSNQVIRQIHKKPIHSDQLTQRLHRELPTVPATVPTQAAERETDPTEEEPGQPKAGGKKEKATDLRARIDELERENNLLELYRPAMIEGAWQQLGEADRTNRTLRYHIDEGERAFTRLAARLAEIEASHPEITRLKDEAASFRDSYRRVLYGDLVDQTTKREKAPPDPETDPEAENWTRYSQGDLHRYNAERQTWLAKWAATHNYPAFPYRSHWKGKGYLTLTIQGQKRSWNHLTTEGWPYLVYCVFIQAYAPGQLEHFLNEAQRRGDIELDQLTTQTNKEPVIIQATDKPPRCSTVYSPTRYSDDGTYWHTPNTHEPGGYDVQGNYWCADCNASLELMNTAESLGYPEISYYPQNPEGMRASMIHAGREEWQRRLPQIWNIDTIREKVQLLLKNQETDTQQAEEPNRLLTDAT